MSLGIWRSVILRTNPKQVVYGFGHDFSDAEVWIVQGGGKRIARLSASLSRAEAEEAGRIIRQAPVLVETCREASRRLAKAQHPNAKALRALIHGALQGLEIPLDDHSTDRIDP